MMSMWWEKITRRRGTTVPIESRYRIRRKTKYQDNIPCAVTFLWRNAKLLKKIFEKLD